MSLQLSHLSQTLKERRMHNSMKHHFFSQHMADDKYATGQAFPSSLQVGSQMKHRSRLQLFPALDHSGLWPPIYRDHYINVNREPKRGYCDLLLTENNLCSSHRKIYISTSWDYISRQLLTSGWYYKLPADR